MRIAQFVYERFKRLKPHSIADLPHSKLEHWNFELYSKIIVESKKPFRNLKGNYL